MLTERERELLLGERGLQTLGPKTYVWCPDTPARGYQSAGHRLKEKDNMVPFVKRNAFFLLRMRHLIFLLETSGSFCKFDSFLFIFISNFFNYLFVPYKFNSTLPSQQGKIWSWSDNLTEVNIWVKVKDKLAILVEGDPEAPFLVDTTPRCREGCSSIPWIAPFYPWSLPYNAKC